MAVLSWDEIRSRAMQFQNEWANESSENAESKTFWNEFFEIFGVSRRRIATFEERVKIEGQTKFVDLLWKGKLLIEHKSKGKNLDNAYTQAKNYFKGIKDRDLPQYILVSDFEYFRLYDLDNSEVYQFELSDLYKNVQLFSFIAGYEKHEIKPQDPVNNKAAEMMGKIHDSLQAINYTGEDLDTLLVRLVFCMFADDTGIFNKGLFRDFLEDNTSEDGADLAPKLQYLFEILDTPTDNRIVDDSIYSEFPYVNGSLFTKHLRTAVFNEEMRSLLIECSNLDWGRISPAIFGSMFQSAMDSEKRRLLGAHYTSEENIMKVIKPLFLDDLWEEFKRINNLKRNKLYLLEDFQQKISKLNFFDPACGSGNFLIIAYRELRKIELEVLKVKNYEEYGYESFQMDISLDFNSVIKCDVNQFYGIEIDSFSAQIAQVALWIIDHQMNIEASLYFGTSFARLPLGEHATIINGNSLDINWNDVLDARDCNYILGNPPFVGTTFQTEQQTADIKKIFTGIKGTGNLDYVSCWFIKASNYIIGSPIKTAFVSTNSITQGQQVAILWQPIIDLGITINFAYQTFEWTNDAKGMAHVHCVIIGFQYGENSLKKKIYTQNSNTYLEVNHINPYLLDGKDVFVTKRSKPLDRVSAISYGNKAVDGGHLILKEDEKNELILLNPISEKYIKPLLGGREFLHNEKRWCLWLVDADPSDYKKMPLVLKRIEKVKQMRLDSKDKGANKIASTPYRFRDVRNPKTAIVIPRTSSERRTYIPMAYVDSETIILDSMQMIPNASLYEFGVLESYIHMLWTKTVCGRLKSDINYSATIVYNNFPWPSATETSTKRIIQSAKEILEVRNKYKESSLANLYDPLFMPIDLLNAHQSLDKVVEKAYRSIKFNNDIERLSYLFELYEKKNKIYNISFE